MKEFKMFKLIYMSYRSNSVRDYFYNQDVFDLMKAGKMDQALEKAKTICGRAERVGLEVRTSEIYL